MPASISGMLTFVYREFPLVLYIDGIINKNARALSVWYKIVSRVKGSRRNDDTSLHAA